MQKEDIKNLLNFDTEPLTDNAITNIELGILDNCIINSADTISEETFGIYKKFVVMKQNAPEAMKSELFNVIKNYIKEKSTQKRFIDAIFMQRFLLVKSVVHPQIYYDIAENLFNLSAIEASETFAKIYQRTESNLPLKLLTLGNFYNLSLKDYKTAIKYYEQYLKIDASKAVIYTILGNLYKKAYGDDSLKEQIYYFEQAHELKPNDRLALHCLAFGYEKLKNTNLANKYYQELLKNNPTPTDYYNYGGFLISCGDLSNGHKYLTHRFEIDDANLKYPQDLDISKKWNFKDDLSDKTLLIHYEQGFGDTFMYCRFVPQFKNLAKKVIFVVQDEVFELIKSSDLINDGIEVLPASTDLSSIEYDYNMALLDCPLVLQTTIENIPFTNGYLSVPEDKILKYRKNNLKISQNLRVGIAYQGNQSANYNGRDINFNYFAKLLELKNIDFYSFNMDASIESGNITNLSKTFNSFVDTACAIKNMDIIISSDNVILNLAGALGVQTYGLFNRYPNFRWFKLTGENVGWYDNVKPLQTNEENQWFPIISECMNDLKTRV